MADPILHDNLGSLSNKILARSSYVGPSYLPIALKSTRPPFFELYDRVKEKLSSAEQRNGMEAKEFYGYLKEWFVRKIDEEGFAPISFDSAQMQTSTLYFESIAERLATAKLEGQDDNVRIYTSEFNCHMDYCKKEFPFPPIKAGVPILRGVDLKHLLLEGFGAGNQLALLGR